jgi:hypothetical protein
LVPATTTLRTAPAIAEPDDLFRLAPKSTHILSVRGFDKENSYFSANTDRYVETPGSFVEVVDLYDYGLAYQSSAEGNTIWVNRGRPIELLVGTGNQTLELEGGWPTAEEAGIGSIVYYQRHEPGADRERESTLRRFEVGTGEKSVIAHTGGEGWSTSFSYLVQGTALALVRSESPGMYLIDLENDIDVNLVDQSPVCPVLAEEGRLYDHATIVAGEQILGVREVFNTHDGVVDAKGFYLLDPLTCEETLVAKFTFNNDWYVENMVGYLISLRTTPDPSGEPLPALSLGGEGESLTAPEAMYLRPGYLT